MDFSEEDEKRFVGAFLSTARRDPRMAAIHAGLPLNEKKATAFLARPGVRELVERGSMVAKIRNGEVIDVRPLHPLNKQPRLDGLSAVRKRATEEMQGRVHAATENAARGNVEHSGIIAHPLVDDGYGHAGHGHSLVSPRDKARAARATRLLTDKGEVAGTVKETFKRVLKAKTNQRKSRAKYLQPDAVIKNGENMLQKAHDAQREGIAQDRGDGVLYLNPGEEIATPFAVKKFLTNVMLGKITLEPSIRVQGAALLAKVLGMLDPKNIERERALESLVPESENDIRKEIEKTTRELARLRGTGT